ncbi:unnamed protein product [Bemisia tabaci]|uniref:Uncharacterized protein n=3 Tax=Bemisia tabaci TaxID=7038 RepID=A0A9P0F8F0_BEMTA|nr:unnamed protein product [Bemisia tabaci]
MDAPEDDDFVSMVDKLAEEQAQDVQSIEEIREEIVRFQQTTQENSSLISELRRKLEGELNSQENEFRQLIILEEKLGDAVEKANEVKCHLIAAEKILDRTYDINDFLHLITERGTNTIETLSIMANSIGDEQERMGAYLQEEMQLYLAAKDTHICEVKKSENGARCIEDLGKIKKEKVIDELQPQIQKHQEEFEEAKKCIQENWQQKETLDNKLTEENMNAPQLELVIAEMEEELASATRSFLEEQSAIEAEMTHAQEALASKEQIIEASHTHVQELQGKIADQVAFSNCLKETNGRLQAEFEAWQTEHQKLDENLRKTAEENLKLEAEVKKYEEEIGGMQFEAQALKNQLQEAKTVEGDQTEVLLSKRKVHQETLAIKNKQLDDLKAKVLTLEESLEGAAVMKAQLETVSNENETLKEQNLTIADKLKALDSETQNNEQEMKEINEQIKKTQKEVFEIYEKWSNEEPMILEYNDEADNRIEETKKNLTDAEKLNQEQQSKIQAHKARMVVQHEESDRIKQEIIEQCQAAEQEKKEKSEELAKEKERLSSKWEEVHKKLKSRLAEKNQDAAEVEQDSNEKLALYTEIQKNIVHLQDLMNENMLKDNKEVLRSIKRRISQTTTSADSSNQKLDGPSAAEINSLLKDPYEFSEEDDQTATKQSQQSEQASTKGSTSNETPKKKYSRKEKSKTSNKNVSFQDDQSTTKQSEQSQQRASSAKGSTSNETPKKEYSRKEKSKTSSNKIGFQYFSPKESAQKPAEQSTPPTVKTRKSGAKHKQQPIDDIENLPSPAKKSTRTSREKADLAKDNDEAVSPVIKGSQESIVSLSSSQDSFTPLTQSHYALNISNDDSNDMFD